MSLATTSEAVSRALRVDLDLHNSGYRGGDYYRGDHSSGAEIVVQQNFRDIEGYLCENRFEQHGTLVYVNGSTEETALELASVDQLDMLRTEEV